MWKKRKKKKKEQPRRRRRVTTVMDTGQICKGRYGTIATLTQNSQKYEYRVQFFSLFSARRSVCDARATIHFPTLLLRKYNTVFYVFEFAKIEQHSVQSSTSRVEIEEYSAKYL